MRNHAIPIIYPFMVNLHKGASQFYDFNTRARAFLEQISAPKWSNATISILKHVLSLEPTSENIAITHLS